jgi:hypothetical protein
MPLLIVPVIGFQTALLQGAKWTIFRITMLAVKRSTLRRTKMLLLESSKCGDPIGT